MVGGELVQGGGTGGGAEKFGKVVRDGRVVSHLAAPDRVGQQHPGHGLGDRAQLERGLRCGRDCPVGGKAGIGDLAVAEPGHLDRGQPAVAVHGRSEVPGERLVAGDAGSGTQRVRSQQETDEPAQQQTGHHSEQHPPPAT